ncbi:unnamed protein product [Brassica oleracea var. botrytis]
MAKVVSISLALLMTVVVILTPSAVFGENGFSDLKIRTHLKRLNKPALKSIKSPDGDIIDCVPVTDQPALSHPLLINHTVQMTPSFNPESVFSESKVSSNTKNQQSSAISQLWHVNGKCPENTVPIRRTTKQDLYRASSVEKFGMKNQKSIPKRKSYEPASVLTQNGHQHAIMYVEDGVFYGAKAKINVWKPNVEMPNEFSLAQIWVLGGNFNSDLNSIEAGWQVSPQLYGDSRTRLFTYWTSDAYQGTGCYNLLCSGFVQINREIAMGGSISPLSTFGDSQYDITILIWKDPKEGHWWLQFGEKFRVVAEEYMKEVEDPLNEDGDIIDCVPITKQPAFDHPLLKNHTIQMRPSFVPEGGSTFTKKEAKAITQVWHKNEVCPDNTVPIRRTKKEDILRAKSIESFGKKRHKSFGKGTHQSNPGEGHEYAIMNSRNGNYYGTKFVINMWRPEVEVPNEFSLAQTWLASGDGYDTNTIEAGLQVCPVLYGDNNLRLFVYWTSDYYQSTGCYNTGCSGFVQTSKVITPGGSFAQVSRYDGAQYGLPMLIWKSSGNWWLMIGEEYVGYWPGNIFTSLGDRATTVQWGGEIVNQRTDGRHTNTDMGSGHFADEWYKKASYFRKLETVDGANTLREPQGLYPYASNGNCYNIKAGEKILKALPVETAFKFPSPLPTFTQGGRFANGTIDLGGLEVSQVPTFNKVWSTYEGGPNNLGVTFFEPSSVPTGFSILGYYAQPNNRQLFGWVLVAKDLSSNNTLKPPVDYTLVGNTESLMIKQDGPGYFWQPVAPDGYQAVGLIVTNSSQKPPLDKVRCVRSDLTEQCEADTSIWESNGVKVSTLRPTIRGTQATGVCVGTFTWQPQNTSPPA